MLFQVSNPFDFEKIFTIIIGVILDIGEFFSDGLVQLLVGVVDYLASQPLLVVLLMVGFLIMYVMATKFL